MAEQTTTTDPLLFFIIRLGRLVTNKMSQRLGKDEQRLMGPHMGVLYDLMQADGIRQRDLAVSSLKDKATITRSLRFLEKEGYVLRSPDPVDKRSKRIYLTNQGRQFYQKVYPTAQEVMEEAKNGISSEDLSASVDVLQQMYNNLNN